MDWMRFCSIDARSPCLRASCAAHCLDSAATVAAELGCESDLTYLETMVSEGNGADRQRRAFAEGGMDGLLTFLSETTAESATSGSPAQASEGGSR